MMQVTLEVINMSIFQSEVICEHMGFIYDLILG